MSKDNDIGVGIIGTGFMGKSHAMAYNAVGGVFPGLRLRPRLVAVADIDERAAEGAARQFGFARHTTDWRSLLADPRIGIISITTPNGLHREMAEAAAAAGKHIHCEKPLAPTGADAQAMFEAAKRAGVKTQVGFNYIKNPVLKMAREMIEAGELGEITNFRGVHAEDYMADPAIPFGWRVDGSSQGGAISEIGSHIICVARFLLGNIAEVNADLDTAMKTRPSPSGDGPPLASRVDDIARMFVRFDRGCGGSLEANWLAHGRKMQLEFEVYGTKGSLVFSQERLNELHFHAVGTRPRTAGFTRIDSGPQHAPYGLFCPAPGHQLGFNDLKTIEAAEFIEAIAGGPERGPDFHEAWRIQRLVDAAIASSRERRWMPA